MNISISPDSEVKGCEKLHFLSERSPISRPPNSKAIRGAAHLEGREEVDAAQQVQGAAPTCRPSAAASFFFDSVALSSREIRNLNFLKLMNFFSGVFF